MHARDIVGRVADTAARAARLAVRTRIRRALPFVTPERLIVAPDCGLKYLLRNVAFAKMKAMVDGAELVRSKL